MRQGLGGEREPSVPVVIAPTGRATTFDLADYWHVAALTREVGRKPIGRTVLGVPLVLFRDRYGSLAALADRCSHRNAPLSIGRCIDGQLECRYHGWRFTGAGRCVAVPGWADAGEVDRSARSVPTFPVVEQDGMVWVVVGDGEPARSMPPALIGVGQPGYRTVELRLRVPGPMFAAVENALDVPHTSFLHRGLFRGRRERVPVGITVHHGEDHVEAVFDGEPVPPGVIGRVLSPEGGVVEHVDRFVVPALAQVEYRLGNRHVALNAFYTSVDADSSVLHAVAAYRLPLPTVVARAAVLPLARWVLHQDNWILRRQLDNIRRFGGERFSSTPIDVLGPSIISLLRSHERGDSAQAEPKPDDHIVLMT